MLITKQYETVQSARVADHQAFHIRWPIQHFGQAASDRVHLPSCYYLLEGQKMQIFMPNPLVHAPGSISMICLRNSPKKPSGWLPGKPTIGWPTSAHQIVFHDIL